MSERASQPMQVAYFGTEFQKSKMFSPYFDLRFQTGLGPAKKTLKGFIGN
jgi:hypothetical protein